MKILFLGYLMLTITNPSSADEINVIYTGYKTHGNLTSSCLNDSECNWKEAQCIGYRCQCPNQTHPNYESRECVPVLGAKCLYHGDCKAIDNTICKNNECQCKEKFKAVGTETCRSIIELESPCKNNDDCNIIPNAICTHISKQCQCENKFVATGIATCEPVLGSKCVHDVMCTPVDNAICDAKTFTCQCKKMYTPDGIATCRRNPCEDKANPFCKNGAQCEIENGEVKCKCGEKYHGLKCETCNKEKGYVAVLENGKMTCVKVMGSKCSYHSDCKAIDNTICKNNKCQCKEKFTAVGKETCSPMIELQSVCTTDDDCNIIPNATCDLKLRQCKCKRKYVATRKGTCEPVLGSNCIDGCKAVPFAVCDPLTFKCRCKEMYIQEGTERCKRNSCGDLSFCKNGAQCGIENGKAKCKCDEKYQGQRCETCNNEKGYIGVMKNGKIICEKDPCRNKINPFCMNGGLCVNNIYGEATCVCSDKYLGPKCETCNYIGNYVEVVKNGNKICVKDKCKNSTCQHNGRCLMNEAEKMTCQCKNGYTGAYCDKCEANKVEVGSGEKAKCVTDQCRSKICVYKSICFMEENGKPKCKCENGFSGNQCNICEKGKVTMTRGDDIVCIQNQCNDKTCKNEGICFMDEDGKPKCQCIKGFSGDKCNLCESGIFIITGENESKCVKSAGKSCSTNAECVSLKCIKGICQQPEKDTETSSDTAVWLAGTALVLVVTVIIIITMRYVRKRKQRKLENAIRFLAAASIVNNNARSRVNLTLSGANINQATQNQDHTYPPTYEEALTCIITDNSRNTSSI